MIELKPNNIKSVSLFQSYTFCGVTNSMLYSTGVKSFNGTYIKSLNEYKDLYKDLLIEE